MYRCERFCDCVVSIPGCYSTFTSDGTNDHAPDLSLYVNQFQMFT